MLPTNILDRFEKYCKEKGITGKDKENKLKKLEKAFQKYVYEPGEAIGIVAAQSISEPATQMSIDGKEKVILKYNGAIKIAEIGQFVDTIVQTGQHVEGWDVCDISENEVFVPSFNDREKIEWKRILAV